MSTTRLRKSFHYPVNDSEDDDTHLALDEEEQEKLIEKLREENAERNEEYLRIFLAIPMISTMTYLPAILTSRSAQAKLVSFLNMTSLLATAYILVFISSKKPDRVRAKRSLTHFQDEPGPMNRYLPYLNGGFSFLLALNAIIWRDRNGVHEGFWLLCLLPAVVFLVIMLAKRIMLEVDVSELEDMKYRYKGA